MTALDSYFIDIMKIVRRRSSCVREKVGAILVKDGCILATGYNSQPSKIPHCTEETCLRRKMDIPHGQRYEMCMSVHAEQNCIIQAARHNSNTEGSTMYCTRCPCFICAKMIINAKIIKVIYLAGIEDEMALNILKQATVEVIKLHE